MVSSSKRKWSFFKGKTAVTVFILLLVTIIFTNFFILLSLRTNGQLKAEGLIQVLSMHIQRNVSIFKHVNQHSLINNDLRFQVERDVTTNRMNVILRDRLSSELSKSTGNSSLNKEQLLKLAGMLEKNGGTTSQPGKSHGLNPLPPNCTSWCHRGNGLKPPYLLTAVLLVRIYRHDLAKLSSRELTQWLHYLRYAGFQHVYIYDAFVKPSESQRDVMKPFIQSGYVTYVDWSINNPYTIQGTQVAAYQHCIDKYGGDSKWQAAIDIDEYPFSPHDLAENFMSRFLETFSKSNPEVSEITMQNYLFLGKPIDAAREPLLVGRIRRRTHQPANVLVKPIYKPKNIAWAQVHHNGIKSGFSLNSPVWMLRMNHYWGARLQNWGNDTPKVLKMTEPDYTIEPIVKRIKQCARCIGEESLFVQRWA